MKLSIKRKAKTKWHPEWIPMLRTAVDWASDELKLKNKQFHLDLRLKHDHSVDYYGVQLSMEPLRRSVVILNSARLDTRKVVEILFHEMVHIAQEFHQGLAIDDDMTEAHFEGMVYKFKDEDEFHATHGTHPWEQDAYERQEILIKKYKKFLDKHGKNCV